MSHLLEVKNLKTEFKQNNGIVKAVNGVSYYIDEGEVIAFVGESGSGKSVTQYSSIQLIPTPPGKITDGEIIFEGEDLLKYKQKSEQIRKVRGGKIGIVFQEPMTSLNPVMTIGKQLEESIQLHLRFNHAKAYARAVELLGVVGISDPESRLKAYPHQFSGGMRQRIMIAMALSCNPKLLIADEATTALDVTTQAQILELMKDIVKKTRTALVLVTHNLSVVARYADRVYVMYAGEIVEHGTTKEIFADPHHPYTIGLMKAVPSLTDPKDRKLVPIEGFVTSLINRKDQCSFLNRCPYATDDCRILSTPQLAAIEGSIGHFAACNQKVDKSVKPANSTESAVREVDRAHGEKLQDPILKVQNLKVYFPVTSGFLHRKIGEVKAVDDVSIDIYPGETFGLVGESGCGKSTVARAILRLNQATDGKIIFRGTDITSMNDIGLRPIRRNMSMIFQDPYGSLDPRQRAGDIVMEPMKNFKLNMTKQEMNKRVDELFSVVGLDPSYRDRVPHEFSGGQRQRLVIARSLSTNPSFIVCDEAISSLDVSIQAQVINLLEDLQQKLGLTYLFIAHDLSVVRHISDRVGVMYLGHLVEMGDWKSLYEHPMHPYTQALLDAVPVPDPDIEDCREPRIIIGEVPSMMHRPSGCAFSTRCPHVTETCKAGIPPLLEKESGHWIACFCV